MTVQEIMAALEPLGSESYRRILRNHGARDPLFGVKIDELQKIRKRVKVDHRLALELFATGNYDAMYLAGLIADDARMTRDDLQRWVETAECSGIGEFTVAWVAAGSGRGWDMAREWIDAPDEGIAASGWATLGALVSITPDASLDIGALRGLLKRVGETIHDAPNRVRYTMNGFLIAVGSYVGELSDEAAATGQGIGAVTVDMGGTGCRVPSAPEYIEKVRLRGAVGKKRKKAKC